MFGDDLDWTDAFAFDQYDEPLYYNEEPERPRRLNKSDALPRWSFNENKELNVSKVNKFYVAAEAIAEHIANGTNSDWTQPTIEKAIEHGKAILDREEHKECVVIVKIVAVLKREVRPVKVTRLD